MRGLSNETNECFCNVYSFHFNNAHACGCWQQHLLKGDANGLHWFNLLFLLYQICNQTSIANLSQELKLFFLSETMNIFYEMLKNGFG
jgi:hypothetical protein